MRIVVPQVLLALYGLISWHLMAGSKASRKRAIYPWVLSVGAVLISVSMVVFVQTFRILFLAIPCGTLMIISHLKGVKFCDVCDATVVGTTGFDPPTRCTNCGTSLTP